MLYSLDSLEVLLLRKFHLVRVFRHDGPVGVELPAVVRLDWVNGSAESAGDDETEDKNDDLI
jgi:hypothetical protein